MPDACDGTNFVRSGECAKAVYDHCDILETEQACNAAPPLAFEALATIRCGWANVVPIVDRTTCETGPVGGRCFALDDNPEGGECIDRCSQPAPKLTAIDRDAVLVEFPCFGKSGLSSPIFEEVPDMDHSVYPAQPCNQPQPHPLPALCDCVPQACGALQP